MMTCMGCGRQENRSEVAWYTVTVQVAGEAKSLAVCGEYARLLRLSDRGLLFGATTAIHMRFRKRVANALKGSVGGLYM